MKYRLYVIDFGVKTTILETNSPSRLCSKYFKSVHSGGIPRISIDGQSLTIDQADKFACRHVAAHRPVEIARKRGQHA